MDGRGHHLYYTITSGCGREPSGQLFIYPSYDFPIPHITTHTCLMCIMGLYDPLWLKTGGTDKKRTVKIQEPLTAKRRDIKRNKQFSVKGDKSFVMSSKLTLGPEKIFNFRDVQFFNTRPTFLLEFNIKHFISNSKEKLHHIEKQATLKSGSERGHDKYKSLQQSSQLPFGKCTTNIQSNIVGNSRKFTL